jgi:uncharacterized protein (DUF1501 family)
MAADNTQTIKPYASTDFKALVCIFLGGGNDGGNTIIPYDSASYSSYNKARAELALDQKTLLPITPKSYSDGKNYALHPQIPEIQSLFSSGKLSFLANVGTLVSPTDLSTYQNGNSIPLQLYSHLDQSNQWQCSISDQPILETGWGGRLGDLMNSLNTNAGISMNLSLSGTNIFQVGQNVAPYEIGGGGATPLDGYYSYPQNKYQAYQGLKEILGNSYNNILGSAFSKTTADAASSAEYLNTVLQGAPNLKTTFPSTYTGNNLKMVANLIALAPTLGLKRQIYYVNIGGYDSHASQLASHGNLLADLSACMNAFYNATVELGVDKQVTTFTASDFGRTYAPNSGGTDHAWGNVQMIMGGAVKGGDIFGKMPSLTLGGVDDVGRGRWIPSTSVDQYSATLAKWFGVSASNMSTVIPNIGRFSNADLGFMV